MKIGAVGKNVGASLVVIYVLGIIITESGFVLMSRVACVQKDGWVGFFWCPDALVVIILTGFLKALVWPYLLYNWLFG